MSDRWTFEGVAGPSQTDVQRSASRWDELQAHHDGQSRRITDLEDAIASGGLIDPAQVSAVLADLRHALADATEAHGHHVAAQHAAMRHERRALLAEDALAALNGGAL